ncbi:hypothetical protein PMES_00354 [Profundibacterium mesophilum KAUST100406-0324]|uniref:Uncharacterized protein n=1 Tax=Profundibacterium mesophilum KAUST100406-0324 TaxID=1037889 RepID=A0A921TEH2_9RHOB|nr:hypothetical protein PMES_00354 [Profundibacterium mesophilum KAUST100406-0324]
MQQGTAPDEGDVIGGRCGRVRQAFTQRGETLFDLAAHLMALLCTAPAGTGGAPRAEWRMGATLAIRAAARAQLSRNALVK